MNGAPLPVFVSPSLVNCPVYAESGSLTLSADGSYQASVTESARCILPPVNILTSGETGTWRIQQGETITFTVNGRSVLTLSTGTLSGRTISNTFGALQQDASLPPITFAAVWRKP